MARFSPSIYVRKFFALLPARLFAKRGSINYSLKKNKQREPKRGVSLSSGQGDLVRTGARRDSKDERESSPSRR